MYDIVAVPPATPVTVVEPPVEPTVATSVLLLLQVPPLLVVFSVVVWPWHTDAVPPIAAGRGFIVAVDIARQPVGKVYVILSVPKDTPVNIPDVEPTVAFVFCAVHEPPVISLLSVMLEPTHIRVMPEIAGFGLTVIISVLAQPVPTVYEIVAVPAARPVTVCGDDGAPAVPIVATPVLELLQVPPVLTSLTVIVAPTHTDVLPVIGSGSGMMFTVVIALAEQPEPKAVTVTVYTPLISVVTLVSVVFCVPAPKASGPVQPKPVGDAVPLGVEFRLVVRPTHVGLLLFAVMNSVLTTTFVVAVAEQPEPLALTVTV